MYLSGGTNATNGTAQPLVPYSTCLLLRNASTGRESFDIINISVRPQPLAMYLSNWAHKLGETRLDF